jgi:hypothetical protein
MDRASWIFCVGALATSLALAALGFRLAALPRDALDRAAAPVRAEALPDVDLGGGFGKVPVVELVGHYLENPPAATAQGATAPAPGARAPKRFGGC